MWDAGPEASVIFEARYGDDFNQSEDSRKREKGRMQEVFGRRRKNW